MSASSLKRKKGVKTLKEKYDARKDVECGMGVVGVAQKYEVGKSILYDWINSKEKIMKAFESGGVNLKKKNIRKAKYDDIDSALYKWFCSDRMNNLPVSGILLKEKALIYAKKLKINEFVASNGWFDHWKTRNNI